MMPGNHSEDLRFHANQNVKERDYWLKKLSGDLSQGFQSLCRVKLDNVEFVKKGTIPEQRQIIDDERIWD